MPDGSLDLLRKNSKFVVNDSEELDRINAIFSREIQLFKSDEPAGWRNLLLPLEGGHVPIHRQVNPFEELSGQFKDFKKSGIVVCLGSGLGYQLPMLFKNASQVKEFIVVETHDEPFFTFMTELDLEMICPGNLSVLYAPSSETLLTYLKKRIYRYHATEMQFLSLESFKFLNPGYTEKVAAELNNASIRQLVYLKSLKEQYLHIEKNVLQNLQTYNQSHVINTYPEKGNCALIVASGPSTETNLPLIHALQDVVNIIAVGSALHPLMKAGVEPDFIVVSDPNPVNILHFPEMSYSIPLIYDLVVPSVIANKFNGPRIACNIGHNLIELIDPALDLPKLECWGTVASTALAFCHVTGFKEVAFVGMDFSFKEGKTHSEGYMLESDDTEKIEVVDSTGKNIHTLDNFVNYARYVDSQIEHLSSIGMTIFNCCEGGIVRNGDKITLRDFYHRTKSDTAKKISWKWEPRKAVKKDEIAALKSKIDAQYIEAERHITALINGQISMTEWTSLKALAAFEGYYDEKAQALEKAIMLENKSEAKNIAKDILSTIQQKYLELIKKIENSLTSK